MLKKTESGIFLLIEQGSQHSKQSVWKYPARRRLTISPNAPAIRARRRNSIDAAQCFTAVAGSWVKVSRFGQFFTSREVAMFFTPTAARDFAPGIFKRFDLGH